MALRVCHLADNPYLGGITSHLLTVAEAFDGDAEVAIGLATLPGKNGDTSLQDRAAPLGIEAATIKMSGTFDPLVFRRLRKHIRAGGYDVLHTHGYRGAVIARHARLPCKWVHTCHGQLVAPTRRTRLWQRLSLRAMRRAHAVIAVSRYVLEWLDVRGVQSPKARLVYNGTPQPAVRESIERAGRGIGLDETVFLYAGRLVEGKGLRALIDAVSALANTRLFIVGEGPLKTELAERAAKAGGRVEFVGYVPDLGPWYHLADAVVLPSAMEAFPLMLLEAAACGTPAVASRAGGIPEIISDGQTGLLVPPRDPQALRLALNYMRNPNYRHELGKAARARWEARYTPQVMAEGLRAVYRHVTETVGAPS